MSTGFNMAEEIPENGYESFGDEYRSLTSRILGIVEGKPMTMEVGEGNMNWPYILDACKDSGVEWYIVEQDDSLRDTVESLKMSKSFLEKMGIS